MWEVIYSACLEKTTDQISNKVLKYITKNGALFGSAVLQGVGDHFNVGDDVGKITNSQKELNIDATIGAEG